MAARPGHPDDAEGFIGALRLLVQFGIDLLAAVPAHELIEQAFHLMAHVGNQIGRGLDLVLVGDEGSRVTGILVFPCVGWVALPT